MAWNIFRKNRRNDQLLDTSSLVNVTRSEQSLHGRKRLISKTGHIRIGRKHIEHRRVYVQDLFTSLLDLPWKWILLFFGLSFLLSWLLFALLWSLVLLLHGDFSERSTPSHLRCINGTETFSGILLYSIETQQTIGYGSRVLNEQCSIGILLLIVQSCCGLIIQSLWVGLVYTKLSRPGNRRRTILWSHQACIALRDGHLTFQCRLADMRSKSTLAEAHLRMYFISERQTKENERIPLNLYDMSVGFDQGTDRVMFNWPITIEHHIDQRSPLYELDRETIRQGNFEILLVLEGIIETTGMSTQVKTSYLPDEIVWAGRFAPLISLEGDHYIADYSKFDVITPDQITPDCSAKQLEQ